MSPLPAPVHRYQPLDLARGFAVLLMIAFHLSFDLNYFGLVAIDFYHTPFWLNFRSLIVTLFLTIAGVSLYLATRHGIRWRSYLRRLGLILLYAALVSIGSYLLFPRSWIFFGVLHFVAVASVAGLLFRRLYITNLVLGVGILILYFNVSHPLFDRPLLQWVGMVTRLPITEDYVPIVPWFGVVLIGMFLGRLLFERPHPLLASSSDAPLPRGLAFAGRHSLHIYILHQPVLMALIFGLVSLTK